MPCIHHNGVITRYLVQYGVVDSGSMQNMCVSETSTTIYNLIESTTYTIKVAAVNDVGIGVYSEPMIITAQSK